MWWRARSSGFFFIVGLQGSASANLGPLLPAMCGGFSAALMLLIVDAAAGPFAGVIAAAALMLLPGFMPLHRDSLTGPPLLAITLLMVGVMVHAPRFSLAYGTLGAVGGVFVATEGIGLPLGAAAWALWQPTRDNGRLVRIALSLLPSALVLWLAHLVGGAWPHGVVYGWRIDLDRALYGAAAIVAHQLAPMPARPGVHVFVATAVVTLLVVSVLIGWRGVAAASAEASIRRAVYPVVTILFFAMVIGLLGRAVLVHGAPEPDVAAMLPLVALLVLLATVSVASLWNQWSRSGRVVVALLSLAWAGAAAGMGYFRPG